MQKQILPALKMTVILALLIGLVFPVFMTLIAQFFFPKQANGSLVYNAKKEVIGSELIGQQFTKPEYFRPRPSAAGAGYAGEASSGTNLSPTSSKLILGLVDDPATKDIDESYAGIKRLAEEYRKENFLSDIEKPPVDAVTRSGSGLDPHISTANAFFQARRIAKVRVLPLQRVIDLIIKHTEERQFGIFGEPRVNVLKINLALEEMAQ